MQDFKKRVFSDSTPFSVKKIFASTWIAEELSELMAEIYTLKEKFTTQMENVARTNMFLQDDAMIDLNSPSASQLYIMSTSEEIQNEYMDFLCLACQFHSLGYLRMEDMRESLIDALRRLSFPTPILTDTAIIRWFDKMSERGRPHQLDEHSVIRAHDFMHNAETHLDEQNFAKFYLIDEEEHPTLNSILTHSLIDANYAAKH